MKFKMLISDKFIKTGLRVFAWKRLTLSLFDHYFKYSVSHECSYLKTVTSKLTFINFDKCNFIRRAASVLFARTELCRSIPSSQTLPLLSYRAESH